MESKAVGFGLHIPQLFTGGIVLLKDSCLIVGLT